MVESISRKAAGRSNFVSVGVVLFLGLFCAVGIAVSTFLSFLPIYRAIQSRSWAAASCEVLSSRVVRSDDMLHPDIQYRYHVDDRPYTGTLYNFIPGSDNFSDYQAVVDRYPPGRRFECYVNPADPAQAVIDREVTYGYFFGLIFFVFFTVMPGGFIVVWFLAAGHVARQNAQVAGATAAAASTSGVSPAEMGRSGRLELKPRISPLGKLISAILICLFWNGIVGVFTFFEIAGFMSGEGSSWFLAVFLLIFQIIGLGLIVNVPYQMLALANPRPTITLGGQSVPVGGSVSLEWQLSGAAHRVRLLSLTLEGREEAVYRQGKNTRTETSVFHRSTLKEVDGSRGVARGAAAVRIPDDTMHTFTADHNKIIWAIKMKGQINRWPDIDESFDIMVTPVPSEHGRFRGRVEGPR